jgi:hypothetical protein
LPRNDDFLSPSVTASPSPRLRRLLGGVALILLAVLAVEQLELTPSYPLTRMLMQTQDALVLLVISALLLALAAFPLPTAWGQWAKSWVAWTPNNVIVPIVAATIVVVLGTRYVASYTPVSHDEIMAMFDAEIIASGRIMAPIPPEWRSLSWALEPAFRLTVPGDTAWVSTYLPVNAAIRGVLGKVFDPAIANAILVATALVTLLAVSRRLARPARSLGRAARVYVLCKCSRCRDGPAAPTWPSQSIRSGSTRNTLFHRAAAISRFPQPLASTVFHPVRGAVHLQMPDRRWRAWPSREPWANGVF